MDFLLFLLVNAVLFIRPQEIMPMLAYVPTYQIAIIGSLLASSRSLVPQLRWESLRDRPATICVLGLLVAVVLSHLANGFNTYSARVDAIDFGKIVLYYLLLLAVINSPARLRAFLRWLIIFTLVVVTLALLQHHGVIYIPALEPVMQPDFDRTGQLIEYPRLVGTGILNDPNDLSLILGINIILCLYWLGDKPSGGSRWLWVVPLLLFGYALSLTLSRGGLIGLVVGLMVLFRNRYGWWKTIPLAIVALPAILVLFAGRQTDISTTQGTAQERILLWSDGLYALRDRPLFGIGANMFAEEMGKAAHNSFVEAFTELGLFGGTLFVGAVYFAFRVLYRLGSPQVYILDPEMRRLRPFLMALIAGYTTGMMSLSRNYVVPTYLTVGLAIAFLNVTPVFPPLPPMRMGSRLLVRLCGISLAVLLATYVFVRMFARYGSLH